MTFPEIFCQVAGTVQITGTSLAHVPSFPLCSYVLSLEQPFPLPGGIVVIKLVEPLFLISNIGKIIVAIKK